MFVISRVYLLCKDCTLPYTPQYTWVQSKLEGKCASLLADLERLHRKPQCT